MANKYYYIVVNEENGYPLLDSDRLPVYYNRRVAMEAAKNHSGERRKYISHPIEIEKFKKLIINL